MFFSKPKIYTVHINPDLPLAQQSPVFLREDFSWKAFFFGPLWTLYHRLWLPSFWLIALNILFGVLEKEGVLNAPAAVVVQLAFSTIVGYLALDWRRVKLAHTGYITADISVSDNILRAQQRYYDRAMVAA